MRFGFGFCLALIISLVVFVQVQSEIDSQDIERGWTIMNGQKWRLVED